MTKRQAWYRFLILSMTGGIVFQVAYIRYVFLEPTYTALHLSSQDYGNIVSLYGTVAMIMYFVGGWFADRFSPRLLITIAMAVTGCADLYVAMAPGYQGVLWAHLAMAVAGMALYWPALIKAIGMLGDSTSQGRLFGFLEAVRGITSTVVGLVGASIVAAAVSEAAGVLVLIRVYGLLSFALAAAVWFVVRDDTSQLPETSRSAVSLTQLARAARNRYTWLIGGTVMLMYCFYTTLGYFSPLLEHQFGMSAAILGVIGVVRTYVFQFVAGPAGGYAVDKATRSTPRFLGWMFAGAATIALLFLVLPKTRSLMWIALILMFVLSFAIFASRGVYWATVGELGIPESERGGVIGLASGLAYLPDAFLPALVAWWIGDPSADPVVPERGGGYTTLFAVLIVIGLAGVVLSAITRRSAQRDGERARDGGTVAEATA